MPAWRARPSRISASIESVSTAPAKRSDALLRPTTTGSISSRSATRWYTERRIIRVSLHASVFVSCAVWPSCHRNSVVRRKSRGRSSQRTTLHH